LVSDENLELVGRFFIKIKDYFERIFVISHNPLVKEWCDQTITVKKENNLSKIL
jgi:DNA repair exonuclease SbcCD ATPase subunit